MTNSTKPGLHGAVNHHHNRLRKHTVQKPAKAPAPAQTPGTQGRGDAHDPTVTAILGWTPNFTGLRDWADHTWHAAEALWDRYMHPQTPGGVAIDKKIGLPVTTGGKPAVVDLDLSFLGPYVGGDITQADIVSTAKELNCKPALIYAIAKQESGTSSFQMLCGRMVPVILYERHIFRNLTRPKKGQPSPYQLVDPEICGDAYHKVGNIKDPQYDPKDPKHKKKLIRVDTSTKLPPVASDIYAVGQHANYERLCRAYKLDKSAALQSCSWGKYQIMGFNFDAKTQKDVFGFVRDMSSGEPAHIKAFLRFAKSTPLLLHGLQTDNYEEVAEGHNGASWRRTNPDYAKNIETYAKEYK